ncbi:MAG: hypothetical protein ACFFBY_10065, partial [Promethearchaeota archaeon]
VFRIGYYLGYLRELAKKLNRLISGDEITEMTLSLEESERKKLLKEEEISEIKIPSVEEDKAALDDLLGFLDNWEKEGVQAEEFEKASEKNIVSIPKSLGLEYERILEHPTETVPEVMEVSEENGTQFKVYEDEIPPVPLEDYTPMEIEEDTTVEVPKIVQEQPISEELPSLDDLSPPSLESQIIETASEYDTEFVLDKESETFESVLKDLGWDEEED